MADLIAPKRGESVIDTNGRTTLRFQVFLELIAAQITGGGSNGYVVANPAITGATKTKITYDSKGLVTSGADATTSDITEGSNLYYTDQRVADLVTDGTHLTWTFDDNLHTLTGDVLVTLQDAYDDSLVATVADLVINSGDTLQINLPLLNGYFSIRDPSYGAIFTVGDGVLYSSTENGGFVIQDNTSVKTLINCGYGAVIIDAYFTAKDRVETSNDYLTVGT